MLSLFTPTKAFVMENDEMFQKYIEQNVKGATMEAAIQNNATACWMWMTSKKAQEQPDRLQPLMNMLPRGIADRIDDLFTTSMGTDANYFMANSAVWDDIYADYLKNLKELIDQTYTTQLCEDEKKRMVNQMIWRKIEWVTMKHAARQERPFPLLTKSVLPQLADVLSRVQNAIAEVCDFISIVKCRTRRSRCHDARRLVTMF